MIDENTFNKIAVAEEIGEHEVNLREVIEKYAYYWKWYVLSLVFCIVFAFFYLKTTNNQYEVTSTIFIDNQEGGGIASELSAFEDLGVLSSVTKKSIINETGVLKSRNVFLIRSE